MRCLVLLCLCVLGVECALVTQNVGDSATSLGLGVPVAVKKVVAGHNDTYQLTLTQGQIKSYLAFVLTDIAGDCDFTVTTSKGSKTGAPYNPQITFSASTLAQASLTSFHIDVYGNAQDCEYALLAQSTNDPTHPIDLTANEGLPLLYYAHGITYFKFGGVPSADTSDITFWGGQVVDYANISTSVQGLTKPNWRQTDELPVVLTHGGQTSGWGNFWAISEPSVQARTAVTYWERAGTPVQMPHGRQVVISQASKSTQTITFDVVHHKRTSMSVQVRQAERPFQQLSVFIASSRFCEDALGAKYDNAACPSAAHNEYKYLTKRSVNVYRWTTGTSPVWRINVVPTNDTDPYYRWSAFVWQTAGVVTLHSGREFNDNITYAFNNTQYTAQYYSYYLPLGRQTMTIELTPLNGGTFNMSYGVYQRDIQQGQWPYDHYQAMYNTTDTKLVVIIPQNQTIAGKYLFAVMSHEVGATYSILLKVAGGVIDMPFDETDTGVLRKGAKRMYELEMDPRHDASIAIQGHGGRLVAIIAPNVYSWKQIQAGKRYTTRQTSTSGTRQVAAIYISGPSMKRRYAKLGNFSAIRVILQPYPSKGAKQVNFSLYAHLISEKRSRLRLGQPVYATLGPAEFDHYYTIYNYPTNHNRHQSYDDVIFSIRSLDPNATSIGRPVLYISTTGQLSTPTGPTCNQYYNAQKNCYRTYGMRVFQNVRNRQRYYLTVDILTNKAMEQKDNVNSTIASLYEVSANAGLWYYLRLNRVMQRQVTRGKTAVFNFNFNRVAGIRKRDQGIGLWVWTKSKAQIFWDTQDPANPFNHTHYGQSMDTTKGGMHYIDLPNSQLYGSIKDQSTTLYVGFNSGTTQNVAVFIGALPNEASNNKCSNMSTASSCCTDPSCSWCEMPVGRATYGVCTSANFGGLACMNKANGCGTTMVKDCSQCKNGLCWWDGKGKQYKCDCQQGYGGTFCSLAVKQDKCSQYRCKWNYSKKKSVCSPWSCGSSGKCYTDQQNVPYCICGNGYHGAHCQLKDVCAVQHSPCKNNATCVELRGAVVCKCSKGFTGRYCQTKQSLVCLTNPCKNGGKCTPKYGKPACICPTGYYGDNCQLKGVPVTKCNTQQTTGCIMGVQSTGDPNDPNTQCKFYEDYINCALKFHCIDMIKLWCDSVVKKVGCNLTECDTVVPGCNMDIYLQCYATLANQTGVPFCQQQQNYVNCANIAICPDLAAALCHSKQCGSLNCPTVTPTKPTDNNKGGNTKQPTSLLSEYPLDDQQQEQEEEEEVEGDNQEDVEQLLNLQKFDSDDNDQPENLNKHPAFYDLGLDQEMEADIEHNWQAYNFEPTTAEEEEQLKEEEKGEEEFFFLSDVDIDDEAGGDDGSAPPLSLKDMLEELEAKELDITLAFPPSSIFPPEDQQLDETKDL